MFAAMRLEIAERLVCPACYERTPLIVVSQTTRERDLIRGVAGCMRCSREAQFRDGSLEFVLDDTRSAPLGAANDSHSVPSAALDDDMLFRLVALLGLGDAGLPLLLGPSYAGAAEVLVLRHDAIIAVLDADGPSGPGVGLVRGAGDAVPFADGTFHAAALDARLSSTARADAVRCVRVGGRVMAPADVPLPPRVRELARDAQHWVGEVEAPPVVVPLRRA
jgi:hypothetical protein